MMIMRTVALIVLCVTVLASASVGFDSNCTNHFTTILNSSRAVDSYDEDTILMSNPPYLLGRLLSQRPSQLPAKVELCRGGSYAISYEPTMLNPHYSTWMITTAQARSYISGRDSFIQDPDLKSLKVSQANASSKVWSVEWNRGHLAPSRMMSFSIWSKEETYYYSNVAPQWWYFNQQAWETLEQNLFEWVRDRNDTVLYITTGVEYFPWRRINNSFVRNDSVAMPDYYFTAICDVASGESAAFIGANRDDNSDMLQRYRTVREVELEIFGTGGTLFDRQLCRTTSPVNVSHWNFGGYVSNAAEYGSTPSVQDAINVSIWLPGANWHRWVPAAPTTPQTQDLCSSVASPCMGLPDCQRPPSGGPPASSVPTNITKLVATYVSNATIVRDLLTATLRTVLTSTFGWDYYSFMFEVPFMVANVTSATTNTSASSQSPIGIALRLTINFNRTLMAGITSLATTTQLSPTDYIAHILNGTRLVPLETWYKSQGADASATSLNATIRTPADCTVSPPTATTSTTTTSTNGTETASSITTTASTIVPPSSSTSTATTTINTQSSPSTTMSTQESTTTSQATSVAVVSTSTTSTQTTASTPTTTTTTTTPAAITTTSTTTPTTTQPSPLTYINFNLTAVTTSDQLQGLMTAYNGTVLLPCRSNTDSTKTCTTRFGNATKANAALVAANAQSLAGVTSAVVGSAPSTESPSSGDDGDGPPWPLLGGILAAAVVFIAFVVGTIIFRSQSINRKFSSRSNVNSMYVEDDDEYGMNMPTLNSSVMMQDEM